jgi:hypothetical protein
MNIANCTDRATNTARSAREGYTKKVPKSLDQWIRMRLRSILRKRDKRKGRGHGRDHNRYPNAWFAERGAVFLISITHDSAASPTK